MTRIAIVTKDPADKRCGRDEARRHGFLIDNRRPDIVISYGGDGTFLRAEQRYPGVPKLLVRKSEICHTCHASSLAHAFTTIEKRDYEEERLPALIATTGRARLRGVNDIILRNQQLTHAIRFAVSTNGELRYARVIGDGLVVATPFGSTAYYRSITRQSFTDGIGVAFNNTTGDEEHFMITPRDTLTITLLRGPAELAADNQLLPRTLTTGDEIRIAVRPEAVTLLRPRSTPESFRPTP